MSLDFNFIAKCENENAGDVLMGDFVDTEILGKSVSTKIHFQSSSGRVFADSTPISYTVEDVTARPSKVEKTLKNFQYDMENTKRGCFLILNFIEYDKELGLDPRCGAEIDVVNMEKAAKHLGFEYIKRFDNLSSKEVLKLIKAVTTASHHEYDCFGCAILTHGKSDDIIYARDCEMRLSEVIDSFNGHNCNNLSGKPKLFFIQACRGKFSDRPVKSCIKTTQSDACGFMDNTIEVSSSLSSPPDDKQDVYMVTIPAQADFMIAHSSPSDFVSWRNSKTGSWFIQSLKDCIIEYGYTKDIMQIMTKVNNKVASFAAGERSGLGLGPTTMQVSSVTSQLRAEVIFTPKKKL